MLHMDVNVFTLMKEDKRRGEAREVREEEEEREERHTCYMWTSVFLLSSSPGCHPSSLS